MLDIKLLRENRKHFEKKLKMKDPSVNLDIVLDLDEQIRKLKTESEELKSKRNSLSTQIGELKKSGKDAAPLMKEVGVMGDKIKELDHSLSLIEAEFTTALACIPNFPKEDVKESLSKEDNVVIKTFGQKPTFDFPIKNHLELNEKLNLIDLPRGAKMSGSGWPVYIGAGAELEWALLNYMLDFHRQNGYTQVMVPLVVKEEMLFGVGQLPKFQDQVFELNSRDPGLYLIPTSEAAINSLHYDEILPAEKLPLKYCAFSQCFRREAGAHGSSERGIIRTHQFNKVEMFCFTKPEQSDNIFEEMVANAEAIMEGLGLHYRSTLLVSGDMSFGAAKTVDIEVYLASHDYYKEVSSVSNCTDYQARRSKTRFRTTGEKPELVHTLNGSGVATSRLMVALLENNQQADGSVTIPPVLRKYLSGKTHLTPK